MTLGAKCSRSTKPFTLALVGFLILVISASLLSQYGRQMLSTAYADPTTWARTYGGVNFDNPSSLDLTDDGGYVVAGSSQSFGPNFLDMEAWVFKVNSEGSVEWEKMYGGPRGWSEAFAIEQTPDGGYVVGGHILLADDPGYDFWVLKLDSEGGIEWEKAYGGSPGHETFGSLRQTSDGGYIVAGTRCPITPTGGCSPEFWVLKLDSEGGIEWENVYDAGAYAPNSVQQTSDGGYVIAGISASIVGGDDMRILKLDSDGGVEWERTYDGGALDDATSIEQTSDGGFIVLGETSRIGPDICGCTLLLKLNSEGGLEWESIYSPINAKSIEQTSDGGFILAGAILAPTIVGDVLAMKLDLNGDIEWAKRYGGPEEDRSSTFSVGDQENVQQTSDGGYIIAAATRSFGAGDFDTWLLKIDSEGHLDNCDDLTADGDVLIFDSTGSLEDSGEEAKQSTASVQDTSATIRDSFAVIKFPCGDYSIDLFENGSDPSDSAIDLDHELRAVVGTSDSEVDQVVFKWIEPNGSIVREMNVPSLGEDSLSPAEPGRWTLQADFRDGENVVRALQVNFLVRAEDVVAGIGWDGEGDGLNWSDCANWIGDGCPERSNDVTIGSGFSVNLDIEFNQDFGRILSIRPGGELTVLSGVTFSEDIQTTLSNSGTFNVETGVQMFVVGDIKNNAGGIINNDGGINSCTNTSNSGIINNNAGAAYGITCLSLFGNSGTFNNFGTFDNGLESRAESAGTFNNVGTFHNDHDADFRNAGVFNNNGTIVNGPGASFINDSCAAFNNSGEIIGEPVGFFSGPCGQLDLFEGDDPSDFFVNVGDEVTTLATTEDPTTLKVEFEWRDPSGNVEHAILVDISSGSASDSFTPDERGGWVVSADFGNGQVIQRTLDVSFFVLPESPIGAIAMILSSVGALGGYMYFRSRKPSISS